MSKGDMSEGQELLSLGMEELVELWGRKFNERGEDGIPENLRRAMGSYSFLINFKQKLEDCFKECRNEDGIKRERTTWMAYCTHKKAYAEHFNGLLANLGLEYALIPGVADEDEFPGSGIAYADIRRSYRILLEEIPKAEIDGKPLKHHFVEYILEP